MGAANPYPPCKQMYYILSNLCQFGPRNNVLSISTVIQVVFHKDGQ